MNLFLEAFAWIFAPAQWTGNYALPKLLGEHLTLTAISVLIAAAIAVPNGWLIGHTGKGREVAVAVSGAARAIPAFGLMILLVLLLVLQFGGAKPRLLLGMLRFLAQQCLAILARDLVIIRVDFGEGKEAVPVPAIIDEGGLERRLHAGHLGEIDIPLELLVLGGFEVKFLDPVSLDHRHPGFFLVARIDQHTHCH